MMTSARMKVTCLGMSVLAASAQAGARYEARVPFNITEIAADAIGEPVTVRE
jgi:hypothetical protein